ncbi:hypothetical protein BG005_003155 [Podila minutissima]|nr:hypothetical protein BG005_003155 [Podila minutissima]
METALLLALAIATLVSATTYFEKTFSDDNAGRSPRQRQISPPLRSHLAVGPPTRTTLGGFRTTQDSRFYSASTPLSLVFDTSNQDLIVQYTVKQEIHQESGGSYIKLLPAGYDAVVFNGESKYAIMFGPDVCGAQTRVRVIFSYKGKNF